MVFADQFAKVSDAYFQNVAAQPGALTAWSATFAFAMQIFFDFSGYTDMAIGCARLLGFHFPENFARPYLAGSITEFWRRWHMSLSRWLRDYLYIPLGGNRQGKSATYRNLMITMLLGGLWHGANWNFILWGGWHGGLLSTERSSRRSKPPGPLYLLRWLLTFVLVLIGWVLFRAPSVHEAAFVYHEMFLGGLGTFLLSPGHLVLVIVALVIALAEEKCAVVERFTRAPVTLQVAALTAMFLCLEFFSVTDEKIPFIYFQF
jgi:alginate O-acetyltransferase complex protein AlgI